MMKRRTGVQGFSQACHTGEFRGSEIMTDWRERDLVPFMPVQLSSGGIAREQ